MDHGFDVLSKNSSSYPKATVSLSYFSSRSFTVLNFSFRYMTYFQLTFMKDVTTVCRLNFLPMNVQLFQHHFLKKSFIHSPLDCFAFFLNNQLCICRPISGFTVLLIGLYVYTSTNTYVILLMVDL